MRNAKLMRIVITGLMLALEIILSRFLSISTPIVKIGFAFIPVVITGILYGWPWSMAVAGLGDFIGALLFPIGAYFPGFTFSAALSGALIGLALSGAQRNISGRSTWQKQPGTAKSGLLKSFLASLCSLLLCSLILDTLFIYMTTSGATVLGLLPARLLKFAVMLPVQTLITYLVLTAKERIVRYARQG